MKTPTLNYFKRANKTPKSVTALSGKLILSDSNWVLLEVPNAIVYGLYAALDVPGIELPKHKGKLNAHISVMRAEEVEAIGGGDIISERGKSYHFQIGNLKEVKPIGWEGVERVWFVEAFSPELSQLRRSYGLTSLPKKGNKNLKFHITVAIRKSRVLQENKVTKTASIKDAVKLFSKHSDEIQGVTTGLTPEQLRQVPGYTQPTPHNPLNAARQISQSPDLSSFANSNAVSARNTPSPIAKPNFFSDYRDYFLRAHAPNASFLGLVSPENRQQIEQRVPADALTHAAQAGPIVSAGALATAGGVAAAPAIQGAVAPVLTGFSARKSMPTFTNFMRRLKSRPKQPPKPTANPAGSTASPASDPFSAFRPKTPGTSTTPANVGGRNWRGTVGKNFSRASNLAGAYLMFSAINDAVNPKDNDQSYLDNSNEYPTISEFLNSGGQMGSETQNAPSAPSSGLDFDDPTKTRLKRYTYL